MTAIPLAGCGRLEHAHRRTTAIRAGLAALLVALVVVASVASARPAGKTLTFLPGGTTGIVVLVGMFFVLA